MSDIVSPNEILKKIGLKITKNREQVLSILQNSQRPLNHLEIMDQLPKDQSWDRVTIYRALADLEEKQVLATMLTSDRITYFELKEEHSTKNHHHGHVICETCKRIECVDNLEKQMPKNLLGYKILTMDVTFRGVCKDCQ